MEVGLEWTRLVVARLALFISECRVHSKLLSLLTRLPRLACSSSWCSTPSLTSSLLLDSRSNRTCAPSHARTAQNPSSLATASHHPPSRIARFRLNLIELQSPKNGDWTACARQWHRVVFVQDPEWTQGALRVVCEVCDAVGLTFFLLDSLLATPPLPLLVPFIRTCSTRSSQINVALEELKSLGSPLTWVEHPIDISQNVQKQPWFLAEINPNGRIPAMVDYNRGAQRVFETGSILLYLSRWYDAERYLLHFENDRDETEMVSWIFFQHGGYGTFPVPPSYPLPNGLTLEKNRSDGRPSRPLPQRRARQRPLRCSEVHRRVEAVVAGVRDEVGRGAGEGVLGRRGEGKVQLCESASVFRGRERCDRGVLVFSASLGLTRYLSLRKQADIVRYRVTFPSLSRSFFF